MTDSVSWVQPGVRATLIWYDGVAETPDRQYVYQVAGPVLETPPESPYFVLAPSGQSDFAGGLYRAEVSLADLRAFLEGCDMAEGRMSDDLEFVAVHRRTPLLPLLDAWGEHAPGEILSYGGDIDAFLPADSHPLFVTSDSYRSLQREPDWFATTWVCEECGEAEDAAVFLWTTHHDDVIQVRLSIENQGGVWACRLYPFKIRKEVMTHA